LIPPSLGFIECNNDDGAARGSLGGVACGGIFRDSFGAFRRCFSVYIGVKIALHAKIWAAMIAIEYVHLVS